MSGAHCTEQKLEGVWCHSLHAPSIPTLLQEYQQLLQHLLGPKAGTMLLHLSGGLDSFINSSSEFIKRIQPHHPCLKFINCLMEAQNSAYGCLGLYVGVLCLSLLKELLQLGDNFKEGLSQRTVKEATNTIMSQIIGYLDTKPNNFVAKLDISNLDQMLALVGTTLGSKNLGLNHQEKQNLKIKIVETFLASIPSTNDDVFDTFVDVTVTIIEGQCTTEAQFLEGLLYREPDPNRKLIDALKQKKASHHTCNLNSSVLNEAVFDASQNELLTDENFCTVKNYVERPNSMFGRAADCVPKRLAVSKYSRNLLEDENDTCSLPHVLQPPFCIRVVLFNVPLVFEQSETECLKFTGGSPNSDVYDTVIVAKLRELVRRCCVDIIACQKVVSAGINFELERDGVLVLERLGTALTDSLQRLTGCVAISDVAGLLSPPSIDADNDSQKRAKFNTSDTDAFYNGFVGSLTDVRVVEVGSKTYLQLENNQLQLKNSEFDDCHVDRGNISKGSPVVTFLLPALSSVTSDSLKAVAEESLRVLRHAALHPLVTAAGGCFEAALSLRTSVPRVKANDDEVTTDGRVAGQSFHQPDAPQFTSYSEAKRDEGEGAWSVDEVLAAVDRLLLEEDDAVEDAVSELPLRQVARVFAKVFANLSVLLSGGTSASSFDFSVDTRTSHLIPDVAPAMLYGDRSSSSEDLSFPVRCSCRSTLTTSSSNARNSGLVDLRALHEHQPALITLPFFSPIHNHAPGNPNSFSSANVTHKFGFSSSETKASSEKKPVECVPQGCVYEVTADCLVESYHAKVNAIRLAFEGVVQLLSVDYCVFDR